MRPDQPRARPTFESASGAGLPPLYPRRAGVGAALDSCAVRVLTPDQRSKPPWASTTRDNRSSIVSLLREVGGRVSAESQDLPAVFVGNARPVGLNTQPALVVGYHSESRKQTLSQGLFHHRRALDRRGPLRAARGTGAALRAHALQEHRGQHRRSTRRADVTATQARTG